MTQPLLSVDDLHVHFSHSRGSLHAVRGVSFSLFPGEILGIVGESGCGKSATLKALTQLNPRQTTLTQGKILYQGQDLLSYSESQMRSVRGKEISMIFQDPMTSLNPTMKIGAQIIEGYRRHFPKQSLSQAKEITLEMLAKVGIPLERFHAYPHMLSGGMRQRVMIALALACKPRILLADEPTTALDVTIQAQILALLKQIQQEMPMSIILITHDMQVIANICSRVLVMYAGHVVESAPIDRLFSAPHHPYTRRLLAAIPRLDQGRNQPLLSIDGSPPNLSCPPPGCGFSPRCSEASAPCHTTPPPLVELSTGHLCACFHPKGEKL